MGNALKKTMLFLGLAEEQLDELDSQPLKAATTEAESGLAEAPGQSRQAGRAPITPLRKVAQAKQVSAQSMNEIVTMRPNEYRDATAVAETFRDGVPVILNLSRMHEADAKRLIDFASGLTMGLRGKIERITSKVFLITPEHIDTYAGQDPGTDELPGTRDSNPAQMRGSGLARSAAEPDTFFVHAGSAPTPNRSTTR